MVRPNVDGQYISEDHGHYKAERYACKRKIAPLAC
jgi:hypothetical protein